MQKTLKKTRRVTVAGRVTAAFGLALLISFSSFPGVRTASAVGSTCNSITDCTNQINAGRAAVNNLQNQAVNYKDAITRLSSEIGSIQNELTQNRNEQAQLEKEIADAQAQIAQQKTVLAEVLRTLYIDGQMTTIEALATSNRLSDYVDKEEYRTAIQRQIEDTLDRISKLQAQLQAQKQQVSSLISQQQSQAAALAADRAQQNSMLGYNQSQQASYNAQTAANQSKLAALIAAQRSANNTSKGGYYFIRFPGNVGRFAKGAYPYASSGFSMSTAPGCNDNDGPDKWGYCTRQCVSYTAYAVEASGRKPPRFWGDAKKWPARAKASGIPVYNTPQVGDIAISMSGNWGHSMYVVGVSGNNMTVWQYNQQLDGRFSEQTRRWQ